MTFGCIQGTSKMMQASIQIASKNMTGCIDPHPLSTVFHETRITFLPGNRIEHYLGCNQGASSMMQLCIYDVPRMHPRACQDHPPSHILIDYIVFRKTGSLFCEEIALNTKQETNLYRKGLTRFWFWCLAKPSANTTTNYKLHRHLLFLFRMHPGCIQNDARIHLGW